MNSSTKMTAMAARSLIEDRLSFGERFVSEEIIPDISVSVSDDGKQMILEGNISEAYRPIPFATPSLT